MDLLNDYRWNLGRSELYLWCMVKGKKNLNGKLKQNHFEWSSTSQYVLLSFKGLLKNLNFEQKFELWDHLKFVSKTEMIPTK